MSKPADNGILQGLRVVELSHAMAAPLVGMMLAEQGAEVVRITEPGAASAPVDPVLDALLARGKTEVCLDRQRPTDVDTLHRLLAHADVVLEDETDNAWVDLSRLRRQRNPTLVVCRIPAFPADDPRASLPGHEAVAGAAGLLYTKPIGKPRYHPFPIPSITAALYSANAVMAALIARERLGRGQDIEVSLCHGSYAAQVLQILIKAGVPRGFLPLKMIGSPFMRCWLCGDERFVYLHITLPTHNAQMLDILERNGHAEAVGRLRAVMSPETMRDPSQVKSIDEAKKIKAIYDEIFLSRTAEEWELMLGDTLCCIKVRTVKEWLKDSMSAGMTDASEVDDPLFGKLLGPGALVASAEKPPVLRPREVLAREAAREIAGRWEAAGHDGLPHIGDGDGDGDGGLGQALAGIKVLDLSRVIAGPCAARVLAEFGAEVLSLQSETRLDWALSFHLIFNAGKRSVTLDFTDDQGKEKLFKLMDRFGPDALIHNYRHLDLARTIGVGPEAMRERYPGVAYTHLNAYGNHGIWQERPGFEQVVQAVSGMQLAYADKGRPRLLPSPIIDIGCGLLGAFGSQLALYNQRRTGQGIMTETHLTSVSVLLQLHSVSAFQREQCLERAAANSTRGHSLVHDLEREVVADILFTLSGYACLCGPRRDLRAWLVRSGLASEEEATCGDLLELARKKLYRRPLGHWQRTLVEAGVQDSVALLPYPSIRHIVEDIRRHDPRPTPIIRRRDYPGSPQPLTFVGSPVRMSLTPVVEVATPPERGADTHEVLADAGIRVPRGSGVIPYPEGKSLPVWLASFIRWGYFAWKSGNI